ncbi:hypothetical protein [Adlercreutzia sp.]|uniref:hypothetical protein n=1 Tax=Adlercreutzia sp. TaxID=1872387 RepID=UPI003A890355
MNTQTLDLDLSKDGLGGNLVRVGQGDKSGTTIQAYIFDNGEDAALSGFVGYLEVLLPNKRNYYRAVAALEGNVATVTVDENKLCSVPGYTDEAYFAFEKDGVRYSTERFAIEILRCATEGQQPAKNWDDAIDQLISRGNAAVSAANTAAANANDAAQSATTAAASANDAAGAANTAATRANTAADSADTAITNANAAATAANTAAGSANSAAASANAAASEAHSAAVEAIDAANKALSIAGGGGVVIGGGGGASSADVEQINKDIANLARLLCDETDKYVIANEICYVPASRFEAFEDGVLTLTGASYANDVITLV